MDSFLKVVRVVFSFSQRMQDTEGSNQPCGKVSMLGVKFKYLMAIRGNVVDLRNTFLTLGFAEHEERPLHDRAR